MAVACKRKLKLDGAIVSVSTAYLIKNGVATRYKVPPSVAREVVAFDRSAGFAPGRYALRAPTKHEQIGAESHHYRGAGPHKSKKRQPHHITQGIRAALGRKRANG